MIKTAKKIIDKDINNFIFYFTQQGADAGLHVVIGKIGLAAELELISVEEMETFIDRLFAVHAEIKNFTKN